jgi:hypothetical protein
MTGGESQVPINGNLAGLLFHMEKLDPETSAEFREIGVPP